MTSRVDASHDRLQQAIADLRETARTATGDEYCAVLRAIEAAKRSLDQVGVLTLAGAEREGVFTGHGYRSTAGALADLVRWDPRVSRRFVTAAEQVVDRVGLDGDLLPARLAATAAGFAAGEISMRHVEVIAGLLATPAAERIPAEKWAAAEQELAGHAPDYTPAELHTWGTQLIEALDDDGPEPDDRPEPQINELRLTRHQHRPGGRIRGRFDDAEMFDRVAAALDTHGRPRDADDTRTPPERQAEGLAEVCGYALAHAPARVLPETGGRRPQLVVTIRLADLERRARTGWLEFGGPTTPAALRMLACDAGVLPVVLGGNGEPVDVGRAMRTVPEGLRRAVTARDRGCAHPGCDLPPAWCQIHHIVPWAHGGPTTIDNLVMLCATHHRLVHHSRWDVRIAGGRPEFVPPGWIDPWRRPRRKPDLTRVADLGVLGAASDADARPSLADFTVLPDDDAGTRPTVADFHALPDADERTRMVMADFDALPDPEPWPTGLDVDAPFVPECGIPVAPNGAPGSVGRDVPADATAITRSAATADVPTPRGPGDRGGRGAVDVELGPPAVCIADFSDLDTIG